MNASDLESKAGNRVVGSSSDIQRQRDEVEYCEAIPADAASDTSV